MKNKEHKIINNPNIFKNSSLLKNLFLYFFSKIAIKTPGKNSQNLVGSK
jgi:hypothetical protein